MEDRTTEKDRWQELADLLGLPPEPGQSKRPVPEPRPAPTVHAKIEVEEIEEPFAEEPADDEPEADEGLSDGMDDDPLEMEINVIHGENDADMEPLPDLPEPFVEIEPETLAEDETAGGDEEPRRGKRRRRGRRGRRGAPERTDEQNGPALPQEVAEGEVHAAEPEGEEGVSVDDEPHAPALAEDDDKRPRRRRRRRGGRKAEPEARPGEAEDIETVAADDDEESADEEIESAPIFTEEEGDEEGDNLSDWDVPSWQELIEGLYRPDR